MSNPKKALAAFNAAPIRVAGFEVYPITLRYAAILEEVESPVITGRSNGVIACWTDTLFVLTHPATTSRDLLASGRDTFDAEVERWSDRVPTGIAIRIIQAVLRQTRIAMGVNPDADGGDDEKNR